MSTWLARGGEIGRAVLDDGHDGTEEGGSNIRQIVAVALVLLVLLGGGLWLTGALRSTSAIQDCAMAGRTNCAPIGR